MELLPMELLPMELLPMKYHLCHLCLPLPRVELQTHIKLKLLLPIML
jgi:hypothetical protein